MGASEDPHSRTEVTFGAAEAAGKIGEGLARAFERAFKGKLRATVPRFTTHEDLVPRSSGCS